MSLDLWLRKTECPTCHYWEITESANYTYNVSPMWREIYPNQNKMVDVDDLTGKESLPLLECALKELESNPNKFKQMNPSNQWGSYEGFVEYIKKLIEMAEAHPTWKWESSR